MATRPSVQALQSTVRQPLSKGIPAFYGNKTIEQYSAKPSTPISLKHLINYGKHGRNKPDEGRDTLLKTANFLRTELPTRLSHRLRDLQELPYVVISNPRLEHVYQLYLEAFEQIRRYPLVRTLEDNDRFCEFMQSTLNRHRVVIPELAIGVSEASPAHLPPQALDTFMTRMLRSRISRRVVAEQHLALTHQFRERQRNKGKGKASLDERHVGVVDTQVNAAEVVRKCEELIKGRGGAEASVPVILEGDLDPTFAYISEHLEFMIFELIKGAAYATVAQHGTDPNILRHHPIRVTIVHQPTDLAIRVSDEGGGISAYDGLPPPAADLGSNTTTSSFLPPTFPVPSFVATAERHDIFSFSHMRRFYQHHAAITESDSTPFKGIMALRSVSRLEGTVAEQVLRQQSGDELSPEEIDLMDAQSRSGIGLPLSKMFAEYFGGSLQILTLQGHGSDAHLRVHKFGATDFL